MYNDPHLTLFGNPLLQWSTLDTLESISVLSSYTSIQQQVINGLHGPLRL